MTTLDLSADATIAIAAKLPAGVTGADYDRLVFTVYESPIDEAPGLELVGTGEEGDPVRFNDAEVWIDTSPAEMTSFVLDLPAQYRLDFELKGWRAGVLDRLASGVLLTVGGAAHDRDTVQAERSPFGV